MAQSAWKWCQRRPMIHGPPMPGGMVESSTNPTQAETAARKSGFTWVVVRWWSARLADAHVGGFLTLIAANDSSGVKPVESRMCSGMFGAGMDRCRLWK